MPSYRAIAFLTDYGLDDAFVAVCHGVLAEGAPTARVIDVTHLVPPQDVRRGAAVLAQAAPYLSPAVFLAVVDPGVGGERRAVAVAAGPSVLVGPDNGLLVPAAEALGGMSAAVVLDRQELFRPPVSPTFHGRDVFAPIAARLFCGLDLADLGTPTDPASLHRLPASYQLLGDDWLEAEVVDVDGFGNVALAATYDDLATVGLATGTPATVSAGASGHRTRAVIGRHFAAVPPGALVAYVDSAARVALAVNQGRADRLLDLGPGDRVRLARR